MSHTSQYILVIFALRLNIIRHPLSAEGIVGRCERPGSALKLQNADPEDIAIMFQVLAAAESESSSRGSFTSGAHMASLMTTSSHFCFAPGSFAHIAILAGETLANVRVLDKKGAERASRSTEDTKKGDLRFFVQLHVA